MINNLDLAKLDARDNESLDQLARSVREVGFLTVSNTGISPERISTVFDAYRRFFQLPAAEKAVVDMARTGSNRGWGAPRSERVDPNANPDYKEVFDCGMVPPSGNRFHGSALSVYAPNLWPDTPDGFQNTIETYFQDAAQVAMRVLRAIAFAIGRDAASFDRAFDAPMALLRGNYYPSRPQWAGDRDFGIAEHTDYGCLTLLATDGVPGLEVLMPDGSWQAVESSPGAFVINFGEMLEFWSDGAVKATLHRVVGSSEERLSIPLFFNPSYDTNVGPEGAAGISAGDHLTKRYAETYLHLNEAS